MICKSRTDCHLRRTFDLRGILVRDQSRLQLPGDRALDIAWNKEARLAFSDKVLDLQVFLRYGLGSACMFRGDWEEVISTLHVAQNLDVTSLCSPIDIGPTEI